MNTLSGHTKLLEYASFICAFAMICVTCSKWLLGWIPVSSPDLACFWLQYETSTGSFLHTLPILPLVPRLLGLLVDSIAVGLACTGIVHVVRLCRLVRTGDFFSSRVVQQFHTLTLLALAWTLYHPIHSMLLSIITSLGKTPHVLAIGIGTDDVVNIIIVSVVALLTKLVQEGAKLKQEQDLTV